MAEPLTIDSDAFKEFFDAYVATALWASTDSEDESLDDQYGAEDIVAATLDEMQADCADFFLAHAALISAGCSSDRRPFAQAGQDFWLTRCRHGAGFWDGRWPDPAAKILTDAAHVYGGVDLYVGDDGFIHA